MGWSTKGIALEALTEDYRAVRHSQALGTAAPVNLISIGTCYRATLRLTLMMIFGKRPHAINIQGVSTLILNPTDQLLHVCVHGAAWDAVPHVRWWQMRW